MANVPTAFFGPRSKENARRLLALADELDIDQRLIRTTSGGYLIPDEIEAALVAEAVEAQEAAEAEAEAESAEVADSEIAEDVQEAQAQEEVQEDVHEAEPVPAPERPAGNASRDAWATYAASTGVTFPEEATRGEIIALVDEKEGSN